MTKIAFLSIALLLLTGSRLNSLSHVTQDNTDQIALARRRVREPPGKTEFMTRVVRVPLVGSKTLPLVEAKLNGKGPYKFLVDSAANVTLLQMRVADEVNLTVLRPGERSKLVLVESIEIGGARFKDLVVGARSWNENIDGVIGFNLFAHCLLTIDYPRQHLVLRQGVLPKPNGKDIFAFGLDNGSPTLGVTIQNESLTVLLDTGTVPGLVLPDGPLAKKLRYSSGPSPGATLSSFQTAESQALVGQLDGSLNIGIHEISRPTIHIWKDELPVLGSGLLQYFVLTFDQRNGTVRISVLVWNFRKP